MTLYSVNALPTVHSLSRSPELRADVLGLERPADRHPPLQRDEHREVDRAALAEHTNLTVEKI